MAISFWENVAPGAVQAGVGMLSQRDAQREAEERLRRAQGPLYDATLSQAGKSLSLAGSMDPAAAARDRFNQQQALLAPGYDRDMQNLQRMATLRGQSGISSYSPVPGTQQVPGGAPINPQMAALLAAQSGEKAKSAYDSLNQGEQQLDRLISRSGMLQNQAQGQRSTGQAAMSQIPVKKSPLTQILGGLPGLLGNKDTMGMLGKGFGWLTGGGMQGTAGSNMSDPYGYGGGVGFGDLRQQDFTGGFY